MPDNTKRVTEVHRLSKEAYEVLETKLRPLIVTTNTTAIETSFTLGQQSVLELLRKGFVIG